MSDGARLLIPASMGHRTCRPPHNRKQPTLVPSVHHRAHSWGQENAGCGLQDPGWAAAFEASFIQQVAAAAGIAPTLVSILGITAGGVAIETAVSPWCPRLGTAVARMFCAQHLLSALTCRPSVSRLHAAEPVCKQRSRRCLRQQCCMHSLNGTKRRIWHLRPCGLTPMMHMMQVSYPTGAAAALARARFQQTLVNNASSVFSSPAFLQIYGEPQVGCCLTHAMLLGSLRSP